MKTFGINKNDRVIGQLNLAFDLHSFAKISPNKRHIVSWSLTIIELKLHIFKERNKICELHRNVQLDLIFSDSKYTTTIIIQISQFINFLL